MVVAEPLDLDLLPIYLNRDRRLEMRRIVRHSSTLVCEIRVDVQPSGLPGREEVNRHYLCPALEAVALALRRDSLCFRRADLIEKRCSSIELHTHDVAAGLRLRTLEPAAWKKRVAGVCRQAAHTRSAGTFSATKQGHNSDHQRHKATNVHDGTS